MADFDIMSVREMIDRTFGDPKENTVDFNLLKAIMYILASKLKILQRHVAHEEMRRSKALGLTMSVTELKIHTRRKKRKKGYDNQDSFDDLKSESKRSKLNLGEISLKGQKPLADRDIKSQARGRKMSTGKPPTSKFTPEDLEKTDNLGKDQKYKTTKASSGGKTTSRDMDEDEASKTTKKIAGEKRNAQKSQTAKSIPYESTTTDTTTTDTTLASKTTTDKASSYKSATDKSATYKSTKDKTTADKSSRDKSTADKYATDKSTGKSTDKKKTSKSAADGHTSFDDLTKDQESKTPKKSPGDKTSTGKTTTSKFGSESERRLDDINEDEESKTIDKSAGGFTSSGKSPTSKFSTEDENKDQESKITSKSPGGKTMSGKSPASKFTTEDEERLNDQNKDQDSKSTSKSPGTLKSSGKSPTSKFATEDEERLNYQNKDQEFETTSKSPGGKTLSGKSPISKFTTEDEKRLNDQSKDQESKSTSKSPGGLTSSGKSPTSKVVTEGEERLNDRNKDQESETTSKSPGGKTMTGKSPTSKFTTEDKEHLDDLSKDQETETTGKSPAGQTLSGKYPTAKSTPDKSTTIGTTSTDKSSSTKSTTEKSSSYKSTSEKSTSNDQSYTTEKTSTPKSTTEKTSSSKSTTEKTSTSKSTAEKTSTSKSTTEKTSTSKSTTEKTSTSKSTSDKYSSPKSTYKSTEKSFKRKLSDDDKTSSGSGSTRKKGGDGVGKGEKDKKSTKKRYGDVDDEDEDDDDSSMEILHEKLLLVSRQSSGTISSDGTLPTQEQYRELAKQIRKLQVVFGQSDKFGLLDSLHKSTSMTDPMAAINMAARLDAAEKQLAEMMSTVTMAAKEISGIDLEAFDDNILKPPPLKDWDAPGLSSQHPQDSQNLPAFQQPPKRSGKGEKDDKGDAFEYDSDQGSESEAGPVAQITRDSNTNYANRIEFRRITKEIRDTVIQNADDNLKKSTLISDNTYKTFKALDEQIDAAMDIEDAFSLLECDVDDYGDKINTLDAYISTELTLNQDSLTQMQFELETGLDAMAEALALPNEDANAVFAELNVYFNSFTLDLSNMRHRQRGLKNKHNSNALDLEAISKKVEELRKQKCTRDELNDALSDKVGIEELNGIVAMNQFEAVYEDLEKQIRLAYDLINNKELVWQRAIDDLIKSLNEKADIIGLFSLQNEIHKYIEVMKYDLDEMLAIVGDVRPNPNKKKIDRDGKCVSCGTNVNIEVNADIMEWYISQTTLVVPESIDSTKAKKDDSSICIPGRPIKHPIDPRSLICRKHCGAESSVPCNLDSFLIAEWKPSEPTTEVADRKYISLKLHSRNLNGADNNGNTIRTDASPRPNLQNKLNHPDGQMSTASDSKAGHDNMLSFITYSNLA